MVVRRGRQILGKRMGSYSPGVAVPAGRLVFISGQAAVDDQGRLVGQDMATQARDVLGKVRALVEEAGGSLSNVVKLTAFLTDMDRIGEYGRVREEMFKDNLPASSSVEVKRLFVPGLLIEVEAIAVI